MNAKSNKRALKAGALAAALVAVLLPTGCNMPAKTPPPPPPNPQGQQVQQVSGPAGAAIVPPMHTDT